MSTSNHPKPRVTPMEGGDIWTTLSAPFTAAEVRTRRGPNGRDLRYITARTARHRLDTAVGYANWECRVEPGTNWVKCTLVLHLPDGRTVSREALSGYPPDTPGGGDKVKAADSTAFKRAASLFGVGSYLYGDTLPRHQDTTTKSLAPGSYSCAGLPAPDTASAPAIAPDVGTSSTSVPASTPGAPSIRFTTPREFYHWAKSQGVLCHVEAYGNEHDLPIRILRWSIEEIDAATQAVMERVSWHTR